MRPRRRGGRDTRRGNRAGRRPSSRSLCTKSRDASPHRVGASWPRRPSLRLPRDRESTPQPSSRSSRPRGPRSRPKSACLAASARTPRPTPDRARARFRTRRIFRIRPGFSCASARRGGRAYRPRALVRSAYARAAARHKDWIRTRRPEPRLPLPFFGTSALHARNPSKVGSFHRTGRT